MEQLCLLRWWTKWLARVLRVWHVSSLVRSTRFCWIDFIFSWLFFPRGFPFLSSSQSLFLSVLVCSGFFAFFYPFTTTLEHMDFELSILMVSVPRVQIAVFTSCMRHQVSHSCFPEAEKAAKTTDKNKTCYNRCHGNAHSNFHRL